jgi:hypothetical protein
MPPRDAPFIERHVASARLRLALEAVHSQRYSQATDKSFFLAQ